MPTSTAAMRGFARLAIRPLYLRCNQVAQQANEQYVPALDSSAGCQRGADSSEHNNATAWVNAGRHRQAAR
jgi:hypothetical protein